LQKLVWQAKPIQNVSLKVLCINKNDFSPENRNRLEMKMQTGDRFFFWPIKEEFVA
jgi:hypothetical protein